MTQLIIGLFLTFGLGIAIGGLTVLFGLYLIMKGGRRHET